MKGTEFLKKLTNHLFTDNNLLALFERVADPDVSCKDCSSAGVSLQFKLFFSVLFFLSTLLCFYISFSLLKIVTHLGERLSKFRVMSDKLLLIIVIHVHGLSWPGISLFVLFKWIRSEICTYKLVMKYLSIVISCSHFTIRNLHLLRNRSLLKRKNLLYKQSFIFSP